jgi:hypothetical protein
MYSSIRCQSQIEEAVGLCHHGNLERKRTTQAASLEDKKDNKIASMACTLTGEHGRWFLAKLKPAVVATKLLCLKY